MKTLGILQGVLALAVLVSGPLAAQDSPSADEAARMQPPIGPVPRAGPLPLSSAQERLWALAQLDVAEAAYNLAAAHRLRGDLEVEALRQSLQEIVRRHEVLRTTVRARADGPEVLIAPRLELPLPVVDRSDLSPEAAEAEARRLAAAEARRPFDLASGPLVRATLVRLAAADHVLLVTLHRIVADSWSMEIFHRELWVLYEALLTGGSAAFRLPGLGLQYADFAVWQRRRLAGEALAGDLVYWRQQLAGAPQLLELPTDRPRPPVPSFRGKTLPVTLSSPLTTDLVRLGREQEAPLFVTLLASVQALLGSLSGQSEVVVGTPVAGRPSAETEGLIGPFVNTLVLRTDLSGDPSFGELLGRVRGTVVEVFAHQDLPFERLVEELSPQRSLSHHPLFQVMLDYGSEPQQLEAPGLEVSPLEVESETAIYDLTFSLRETSTAEGNGIAGFIEYSTDLFDEATIRRLWRQYTILLEAVVAEPQRRLSQLPP